MKTTIVPAQITSVEDKIAGNLSFTQLLLFIAPLFVSGVVFVFLPPFLSYASYKVAITILLSFICITLAIRIKTKLILEWLVVLSRYNRRPRFYVFNKNSQFARETKSVKKRVIKEDAPVVNDVQESPKLFGSKEVLAFENIVADPRADFHFTTTRKGGLQINVKEVE